MIHVFLIPFFTPYSFLGHNQLVTIADATFDRLSSLKKL